jgi:hypothetical protein
MAYTTVDNPELYFQTKLYTGNSGTNAITLDGSENMQPDWIWIKERGATGFHVLTDTVRGITKQLYSNDAQVENTNIFSITAIGSNGFTLGNRADVNNNSDTYVAWNWKAGGTASSNTDGSITSTVSANTTSGFSILTFTGTGSVSTIGHGLSATPKVMITKARDGAGHSWSVYHAGISSDAETDVIYLEGNGAAFDNATFWNDTAPTSSVFTAGTAFTSNDYIAYCFAEKKGFSKFGSYTGNGSSDGTFVYTGFKPAFVMTKSSSNGGASYNWQIWDNRRNTYNAVDTQLRPNTTEVDNTDVSYSMDFVSNGFKMRGTNTNQNGSGSTYIYMCFAEAPFTTSTGIPTTAR